MITVFLEKTVQLMLILFRCRMGREDVLAEIFVRLTAIQEGDDEQQLAFLSAAARKASDTIRGRSEGSPAAALVYPRGERALPTVPPPAGGDRAPDGKQRKGSDTSSSLSFSILDEASSSDPEAGKQGPLALAAGCGGFRDEDTASTASSGEGGHAELPVGEPKPAAAVEQGKEAEATGEEEAAASDEFLSSFGGGSSSPEASEKPLQRQLSGEWDGDSDGERRFDDFGWIVVRGRGSRNSHRAQRSGEDQVGSHHRSQSPPGLSRSQGVRVGEGGGRLVHLPDEGGLSRGGGDLLPLGLPEAAGQPRICKAPPAGKKKGILDSWTSSLLGVSLQGSSDPAEALGWRNEPGMWECSPLERGAGHQDPQIFRVYIADTPKAWNNISKGASTWTQIPLGSEPNFDDGSEWVRWSRTLCHVISSSAEALVSFDSTVIAGFLPWEESLSPSFVSGGKSWDLLSNKDPILGFDWFKPIHGVPYPNRRPKDADQPDIFCPQSTWLELQDTHRDGFTTFWVYELRGAEVIGREEGRSVIGGYEGRRVVLSRGESFGNSAAAPSRPRHKLFVHSDEWDSFCYWAKHKVAGEILVKCVYLWIANPTSFRQRWPEHPKFDVKKALKGRGIRPHGPLTDWGSRGHLEHAERAFPEMVAFSSTPDGQRGYLRGLTQRLLEHFTECQGPSQRGLRLRRTGGKRLEWHTSTVPGDAGRLLFRQSGAASGGHDRNNGGGGGKAAKGRRGDGGGDGDGSVSTGAEPKPITKPKTYNWNGSQWEETTAQVKSFA